MLGYKNIIIKRYDLGLSYKELVEEFGTYKFWISGTPVTHQWYEGFTSSVRQVSTPAC